MRMKALLFETTGKEMKIMNSNEKTESKSNEEPRKSMFESMPGCCEGMFKQMPKMCGQQSGTDSDTFDCCTDTEADES